MSRGGRHDAYRGATSPSTAVIDDAADLAEEAEPAVAVEPAKHMATNQEAPRAARFVVSYGAVNHDGKEYLTGEPLPITEAQSVLLGPAVTRV